MAQVSYGTITITDTNDIEEIFSLYGGSNDVNTSPSYTFVAVTGGIIWKRNVSAITNYKYIWQITAITKTGVIIDSSNWQQFYGTPIRITGEEGNDARNITAVTPYYYLSSSSSSQVDGSWSTSPSAYPATGTYYYWTKTITTYDSGNPTESSPVLDMFLTNAAKDARDANNAAAIANSISQSANENAQGAMAQAASNINEVVRLWQAKSVHSTPLPPSVEVIDGSTSRYDSWSNIKPTATDTYRYFYYCDQSKTGGGIVTWSEVLEDTSYLSTYEINALGVKTKNFFKGLDSSYDGWFASGRTTDSGLNVNDATTYYYNARFAATHIALGYNKTPIIDLDGSSGSIKIYRFPTINSNGLVTAAGALGMQLSATSLNFYKPPVGNNNPEIAATLDTNGLILEHGGIRAGTARTNNFVYLSSTEFADAISGHSNGTIAIDNYQKTNWKQIIGNNFAVDSNGNLYANEANIKGTIKADYGYISSGIVIGSGGSTTIGNVNDTANNASYTVEIEVRNINYAQSTATLFANVYYKGVELTLNTDPSISTIDFQWQKVVENSGTYIITDISGEIAQTLITNDLNTTYICVISNS